ncbi:wax ester/triacylglycerol synthase domain-containing protein [Microbacterium sp. NPDC058389]|uniref:wax ester/triacylglycerol synthase domain-containing protein n=1 Tax=Microbacterium sp. NPDC058389 TaxID=3346475 RepID=UPI00364FA132
MTRPVSIDMVRTLDEQKIGTSIAYAAMHAGAVLVIDGAPFLSPDGRIDRELVHAHMRRCLERVPEWRLRLMDSPLGVTTPAWVPDERFEPRDHVAFDDDPVELTAETARRLTGAGGPGLPRDRPLWDLRIAVLDTGEVAVGARMHHVVGDGEWGFSVIRRLTSPQPEPVDVAVAGWTSDTRAPRTAMAIPPFALRDFLARQSSIRGGWHDYWRKPFVKRVKRVASRNAAPLREWWIARTGLRDRMLPPTHAAAFDVTASPAARRAARLRGTLNDLLVASALGAVDDDDRGLDMLVPVSRRRRGSGDGVRNHISMARVHVDPGTTLAERVAEVRGTVRNELRGESTDTPHGRMLGYATIMSLSDDPLWFGEAKVNRVIVFPVGDPRSELSAFGVVYDGMLSVTLVSRLELDVARMADSMRRDLEPAPVAETGRAPEQRDADPQEAA